MNIIFATGNADKMKEIRQILSGEDWTIRSMKEAGIKVDVVEDGETFIENALIKARAIAKEAAEECVVIADDSGLVIDALNGEPGVYSARYMGEDTSYRIKNQNLIDRLEGISDPDRSARFVCAMAAVLPDGKEICVEGKIEGRIGYEERGANGFGYDPIFYLPDKDVSTAELSPEDKNAISHRGCALREMKQELLKWMA